ncbi:MAG: DoxX family protein [Chloroflexi bacterium]|nr:DoxX family protein [Chloroflexota bacterium]MBV9893167.1 DoxX family protein [Chloroflexota bacterium]
MSILVAQLLLAALFLLHGLTLLALPAPVRRQMASLPGGPPFFRFIGFAEVMAAAGLTLPTSTGILPWLTPLAAAGLVVIMLGAAVLHLRRVAYAQAVGDSLVLAFAAFVGYLTI